MCIRNELFKIIRKRSFNFIVVIFLSEAVLNFIFTCNTNKNMALSKVFDASRYSILINDTETPFKSIFDILLPLIICLIASDSFAIDRKYGIIISFFLGLIKVSIYCLKL